MLHALKERLTLLFMATGCIQLHLLSWYPNSYFHWRIFTVFFILLTELIRFTNSFPQCSKYMYPKDITKSWRTRNPLPRLLILVTLNVYCINFMFLFSCFSFVQTIAVIYYLNNRNDVEGNGYGEKLIQVEQDAIIRRNINFATRHLVF